MKRFGVAVCVVVCLVGAGTVLWRAAQSRGEPRIEVSSTADLGSQALGTTVTVPILVTNLGAAPLVLENVRTSCGCLRLQARQGEDAAGFDRLEIPPRSKVTLYSGLLCQGEVGKTIRETVTFAT